jgi:hypothetical protein
LGEENPSVVKGCAVTLAILIAIPLLLVGVVGVRTWLPLRRAAQALEELQTTLGPRSYYTPTATGAIPPERVELFLEIRADLVTACGKYGAVQAGFDAVSAMDSTDAEAGDVAGAVRSLGGAAIAITPFLAGYFEERNQALLEAGMGLEEYSYIYAMAYHDQLLAESTRIEIFSDGEALSGRASEMLMGCLDRQAATLDSGDVDPSVRKAVAGELESLESDPTRLPWQDGLPTAVAASLAPYRETLDPLFCPATAGLEMEQDSRRALRLALY